MMGIKGMLAAPPGDHRLLPVVVRGIGAVALALTLAAKAVRAAVECSTVNECIVAVIGDLFKTAVVMACTLRCSSGRSWSGRGHRRAP